MRRTTAKVITRKNGMALVEWMDGARPNRAWVTPDMLDTSEGDASAVVRYPKGGIPHGVDWSALAPTHVDADEIERRLKGAGVWTVEDLQRRPQVARGVLNSIAGDLLQTLLINAREAQRDARTVEA